MAQIAKANRNGRTIDYDTAYEEVIADSMETMLSDDNVLEKILELKAKDKSIVKKISEFFAKIIDNFRNLMKQYPPETPEGNLVSEMHDSFSKLQEMFAEALVDASNNYQANEGQKNTTAEGGVKFMARDEGYTDFNPNGKSLKEQLKEAYDTAIPNERRYVYVGEFTDKFTDKLKKHLNIKNYPIVMNYRDAYLSMESKERGKYHGDGINYHNLGIDGLEAALNSFDDPEYVLLSKTEGKIELILEGRDYKNRQLFSIVEINTKAQHNRKFLSCHVVTSVYGNRGIKNRIETAGKEGRVIYNKNEEPTQGMPQVQYERDINANSSKDSISQISEKSQEKLSDRSNYGEYNKPITLDDVKKLRSIGRKAVNNFNHEDIEKSQKWAYKFYQQLGEKSPFFRAWFGDWRAYDRGTINMIYKEGPMRSGSVKNTDTNWDIIVSKQVSKETNHHSGNNEINAVKYLPYIIDITQNAVLVDTKVSNKDNSLSAMFHSLYAYTEVMGYPALLKLQVEELVNEKDGSPIYRDYILQNIEEEPISLGKRFSKAHHHETDSSNISISDLFALVKQYDKSFKPNPVNKMFLNEDGTPKKFYHGSKNGSRFTVFKGWQYFTESKEYAERYMERDNPESLYQCYIKMQKPFDTRNPECRKIFEQMRSEYGLSELQENGLPDWTDGYDIADFIEENNLDFDGIILDEGGDIVDGKPVSRGLSYVVRDSRQIKSATDNIGTFDKTESDMRFSDRDTENVTNRSLLVNALESVAQNDIEKNKLKEYKSKIELINSEQEKLNELNRQIKDLSFAKGKRDMARLRQLKEDAIKTANRINTYDRQLFNLESMSLCILIAVSKAFQTFREVAKP